jgi:Protein of unknown function (DUF3467)
MFFKRMSPKINGVQNAVDSILNRNGYRMGQIPSPDDRVDPNERSTAVRARVPEHVATGNISTGVIVVTGATEFVLDFVRNLPRPSLVVARIVMPHAVMPQFVDALNNNMQIYRQRFGDLGLGGPLPKQLPQIEVTSQSIVSANSPTPVEPAKVAVGETTSEGPKSGDGPVGGSGAGRTTPPSESESKPAASTSPPQNQASSGPRQQSPQEVYDELKLRDELLSGAYANAVMIGHGPHEFCFDFITNFYPQSAVSCRVFMSSGHVGRLYDSLKASWEQLRPRLGGNPPMA